MATCHDAIPDGIDERITIDVDLAILGAPPDRFDEYERQIREEYRRVPVFLYRVKRRKLLQRFLERPTIYGTSAFIEMYEERARDNLERSLRRLGG